MTIKEQLASISHLSGKLLNEEINRIYLKRGYRLPVLKKLHLKPCSIAWCLGIRVRYCALPPGVFADFGAGSFGGYMQVARGIPEAARRWSVWHEIAHCLDWSTFNPRGHRRTVEGHNYSRSLASELVKIQGALIYTRGQGVDLENFDIHNVNQFLRRYTAEDFVHTQSAGYLDSEELFGEALAMTVLRPEIMKEISPVLHSGICKILRNELGHFLPDKALEEFMKRIDNPSQSKRASFLRNVLISAGVATEAETTKLTGIRFVESAALVE